MFDESWLQNALERLVSNAVRYTPPGGSVTVAWERENFGVRLSVQDTGCGIAQSDMPSLFDKFYQGWNSQEGLGIGLAVVQRVAQRHGGRVWAESTPGHGAAFFLFFPDLPAHTWEKRTASAAAEGGQQAAASPKGDTGRTAVAAVDLSQSCPGRP